MKCEDYYTQMSALKKEERIIRSKMHLLKLDYLKELPFKVGDKVEIKGYGVAWIRSIRAPDLCGNLNIDYFPPKKSGEKSNKYRSAWFVKIEDIKLI